jgi:opacity protein-like surface antigen
MMERIWQGALGIITILAFWGATSVHAASLLPQAGAWQVGVRSGYSVSPRKADMVPAHLHLGYTVFNGQKWFLPPGALEIGVEPFASVITRITRPGRRSGALELGALFPVLTYSFDLGFPLYPYIEGALGMLYNDMRGYNLGGHFFFTEQVGAGVTYMLNPNLAITMGGRFRHISNASLFDQNVGLNSFLWMGGVSYFFSQ